MSVFQYATIDDIRNENVPVATRSDERILEFLEFAGRYINRVTKQFFVPLREQHVLNGDGTKYIYGHNRLPIQEIKSISENATGNMNLNEVEIEGRKSTQPRKVLMSSDSTQSFNDGTNNIRLDAVFGWLEPRFSSVIELEVASDASYSDKEIEVNSTGRVEDHFIPVTDQETLPVISNVDDSNNKLEFDQSISFPVSQGDTLYFYGLTPVPIRRVAMQIAILSSDVLGTGDVLDFTETPQFKARVIEEDTDNYQYQLAEDIPDGSIKQGDLTSSIFTTLREYTPDQFFRLGAV